MGGKKATSKEIIVFENMTIYKKIIWPFCWVIYVITQKFMNNHALKLRTDGHKFILRVQGFIPNFSYFELMV